MQRKVASKNGHGDAVEARTNGGIVVLEAVRKPFAGRALLAENLAGKRDISEEVKAEFQEASLLSGSVHVDSERAEREMRDAMGVPLRVVNIPQLIYTKSQLKRLSTEIKKLEEQKAKPKAKAVRQEKSMMAQVLEEFASVSDSIHGAGSEKDASELAGIAVTVRPYSISKKKRLQELEKE